KAKITKSILKAEEENFFRTIRQGLAKLEEAVQKAKEEGRNHLTGKEAFKLYDTYGLPVDFIKDTLEELGMGLKEEELEAEMERQRQRSRASWKGEEKELLEHKMAAALPEGTSTEFVGYTDEEADAKVLLIIKDGEVAEEAKEGEEVLFVLDKTPFYAESGGQIADTGIITSSDGLLVEVEDVQKHLDGRVFLHKGRVKRGTLRRRMDVHAEIDRERRAAIRRAHTGTHVLYRVMREILGSHVSQAGSLVGPDYIRFDFTHFEALKPEEKKLIEQKAMEAILTNMPVKVHHMTLEEALGRGAIAEFMDKYKERVRVVEIGDGWTLDLCGGTHTSRTGDIGIIKIVYEGSVSTGVRRIEAFTGMKALQRFQQLEDTLLGLARKLSTSPDGIGKIVDKLKEENQKLQKELTQVKQKLTVAMIPSLDAEGKMIGDTYILAKVLSDVSAEDLRMIADEIRARHPKAVVILGGKKPDGAPIMIGATTKNLTDKLHMG
ncbi:MAG: alanine--tRNA ligase-related protein, partial [Thermococcus sp.]